MKQINTKVIEKIKRPISALSECFAFSYFGFVSTNLFLSSFLMLAQLHQFINDFFRSRQCHRLVLALLVQVRQLGCFVTIHLFEQNIICFYQKRAQNKTFMRTVVKKIMFNVQNYIKMMISFISCVLCF